MSGHQTPYTFKTRGLQELKSKYFDTIQPLLTKGGKTQRQFESDIEVVAMQCQVIALQLAKYANTAIPEANKPAIQEDIRQGYALLFELLKSPALTSIPEMSPHISATIDTLDAEFNQPGSQVAQYYSPEQTLHLQFDVINTTIKTHGTEVLHQHGDLLNSFLQNCTRAMQYDQSNERFMQAAELQLDILQKLGTSHTLKDPAGQPMTFANIANDILKFLGYRIEQEQDPTKKSQLIDHSNYLQHKHLPEQYLTRCKKIIKAQARNEKIPFDNFLSQVEKLTAPLIATPEGQESAYNEKQLGLIKDIADSVMNRFDEHLQSSPFTSKTRLEVTDRVFDVLQSIYDALPDDPKQHIVRYLGNEIDHLVDSAAKHIIERAAVSNNPQFVKEDDFAQFLNKNRDKDDARAQQKNQIELFKFNALRTLMKAEAKYVGSVQHAIGGVHTKLHINGKIVEKRLTDHADKAVKLILGSSHENVSSLANDVKALFNDVDPKTTNRFFSSRKDVTHDAYKDLLKLCESQTSSSQSSPASSTTFRDYQSADSETKHYDNDLETKQP